MESSMVDCDMSNPAEHPCDSDGNEASINDGPGTKTRYGNLDSPKDEVASQSSPSSEGAKKVPMSPPEQALQLTRAKFFDVINGLEKAKPNPQTVLNSLQAFGQQTFSLGRNKKQHPCQIFRRTAP